MSGLLERIANTIKLMQLLCEAPMSTIHLIRTKADYRAALKRIEVLWDAPIKSPEVDELEVLSLLVEAYEKNTSPCHR